MHLQIISLLQTFGELQAAMKYKHYLMKRDIILKFTTYCKSRTYHPISNGRADGILLN